MVISGGARLHPLPTKDVDGHIHIMHEHCSNCHGRRSSLRSTHEHCSNIAALLVGCLECVVIF